MMLGIEAGIPEPDFLERAAESVIEACPTEPLLSPDEAMLRRGLEEVIEGVRDALAGHEPDLPEGAPLDRKLLLRRLRSAVLDAWSDENGSLLATLQAFEATERVLGGADESLAANVFSRRLLREVVHLLLSPLGSVAMLASMLREERAGPLNEAQHRQVAIIHRAATSAASASSALLTLTSPDEHFGGTRRFSVAETVALVEDVVRPVAEARGSELVVRQDVQRSRRGPANALGQALLDLALRAALMTRNGTLELEVSGEEKDAVSFSVTSRGGPGEEHHEDDPFLIFRTDAGSEGYTLSPEALSFSAGRKTLRAIGSDLDVGTDDAGALVLRFVVALPLAD